MTARPVVWAALALLASPLAAQGGVDQQIRRNQQRLDSIRQERTRLEGELARQQGQVRNILSDLNNLERQRLATTRLMTELDRQHAELDAQLDTITLDLLVAEDALAEKRATQRARIIEIYKRGPLWSIQVLLSAESFADLLSRYKYLYLVSRRDQALVDEVQELRDRIARERRNLAVVQREVERNRSARRDEIDRYQRLEQERQRTLRQTRSNAERAQARIAALALAQEQVNTLLADLERQRLEAIRTGRVTLTPTITTASRGRLPWPVEGPVIYPFGTSRSGPNATTIRYDGIGIRVEPGTPVRAVANGRVRLIQPLGTYSNSIVLDHGGGYYTVYLYLRSASVDLNQAVTQGQVLGLSGGEASEEGPHIEFQIRLVQGPSQASAVDPTEWLVRR